MTKSNIQLFFICLVGSSTLLIIANAIKHPRERMAMTNNVFGRDKSPNPAAISYSGCELKSGLSCSSHTDSDIQMGECWSNARVMGQKSAFFVPFQPGHASYNSEGGPYGTCTAYACFPTEQDMQSVNDLANFCFFWDGKDHTVEQNGGLGKRESKEKHHKNKDSSKKKKKSSKHSSSSNTPSSKQGTNNDVNSGDSDQGGDESSSGTTDQSKNKAKGSKSQTQSSGTSSNSTSSTTSSTSSSNGSGSGSGEGTPKAPGSVVIPMPMICPSNLKNCYSSTYFEPGGKLEKYANLKPTYEGVWFPPKNPSNHQPMFCDGLNRGCPTPTMQELQLQHLADQHCDVSKCSKN